MNDENTQKESLDKTTKTTPILTRFQESNKRFLLLDANMWCFPKFAFFSYIIVKQGDIINPVYKIPTMTSIKKANGYNIDGIHEERMQYLKKQIIEALNSNKKKLHQDQIIPLSEPVMIGGQTRDNQRGYGWEWDWSGGIGTSTPGTYYGEMTSFFIIGIKITRIMDSKSQ